MNVHSRGGGILKYGKKRENPPQKKKNQYAGLNAWEATTEQQNLWNSNSV